MIKVFNIRRLIKKLIRIIILLIIIFFFTKIISKINIFGNKKTNAVTEIIDDSIDLLKIGRENNSTDIKEWGKVIIDSEFEILNSTNSENKSKKEESDEENKEVLTDELIKTDENENKEIEQAKEDIITEIIPSGINPKYNREYEGVQINNSTEYELTDDLLNLSDLSVNKEKILIYHTHTCESYTPTEEFFYEETGSYRTNDLNYSVARVGDELEKQLNQYGHQVIHDKTYHDYPSYNGSYSRSLKTVESILAENKDIDIVIDLHRDAIGDSSYAPKVKIGDEYASQLMFVIGTDKANPEHTTWNQNLKFAIKTQATANEKYPGLFKPIILRNSTYNQNAAKAACIIEVGATGNTLEESLNSMKYLAKILR